MNYNDFPNMYHGNISSVMSLIRQSVRKRLECEATTWPVVVRLAVEDYYLSPARDRVSDMMKFFIWKKAITSVKVHTDKVHPEHFRFIVTFRLARTSKRGGFVYWIRYQQKPYRHWTVLEPS